MSKQDSSRQKGALRLLDIAFGEWVVRQFGSGLDAVDQAKLCNIAQAVSYAVYLKHTCLDLQAYTMLGDRVLIDLLEDIDAHDVSRIVTEDIRPLHASKDGVCVWLQKYYGFESGLFEALAKRLSSVCELDEQRRRQLKTLFSADSREQYRAAEKALCQKLTIITGGPGTGKTWTVARIIVSLLLQNPDSRILLAAPTGKAGARMKQSLDNAFVHDKAMARYSGLLEQLPKKALTIEALLGINHHYSPKPRKNRDNPVDCDVLIVDEASMISAPSMFRIVDALPENARLILLGDKDQLSSVEAGSVMGELCASSHLDRAVALLTHSRRFDDSSEIGKLANAINAGQFSACPEGEKVRWHLLSEGTDWTPAWLDSAVESCRQQTAAIMPGVKIHTLLQSQSRFQMLCALREGPQGVNGINSMIEKALNQNREDWYIGKPVMIIENDHERKLYNGDVGLILPVEEDGERVSLQLSLDERFASVALKACFLSEGVVKAISRAQMPAYETCYATTIHKSQGSEYERVMIILPAEPRQVDDNPVLTRELIYTAVTRARDSMDIWSGENVLERMSKKTSVRMSGFRKCSRKCG